MRMSLSSDFLLCLLFSLLLMPFTVAANDFIVTEFGARGDGLTVNTEYINNAIEACSLAGGGTVYFPAGSFVSGTIVLKSNVHLYLEAGSVLMASTDLADYLVITPSFRSYTDVNYVDKSLIYAEKAENLGVSGKGIIDGNGGHEQFNFSNDPSHYKDRPFLIRMVECSGVFIEDITIKDSPMWVQHYLACESLIIDGIKVRSEVNVNNDGIDIDCCRNVRISNCDIRTGDDAIVLKSTAPKMCENIVITNCLLSSNCCAFKIGTESVGGFKNISFSNTVIYNTRLAGIALETVDGGNLERIKISDIIMDHAKGGIFIRLGNRARPYLSVTSDRNPLSSNFVSEKGNNISRVARLKEVTLQNITAVGVGNTGCAFAGIKGHPIEDIVCRNISMEFEGGGQKELVRRIVPENENKYPSHDMFGQLPAYGFYIRHAGNILLEGLQISYDKPEFRPAVFCEDVIDLQLFRNTLQSPTDKSESIIHLD